MDPRVAVLTMILNAPVASMETRPVRERGPRLVILPKRRRTRSMVPPLWRRTEHGGGDSPESARMNSHVPVPVLGRNGSAERSCVAIPVAMRRRSPWILGRE